MDIHGNSFLVTGGASGMGRNFTLNLAKLGGNVAFCDLNEEAIAAVEAEGAELPGKVIGFKANVAVEEEVVGLIASVRDALGGLDGVINNAGIFRDGLLVKPDRETGAIKKMSLQKWQQVLDVDLTGPFLVSREFAAAAVENGHGGVIVNISSISRHGNMGQSNYSAAKAGLVADTKLWGNELARYGIRTGAIAPGFVDTPILQGMRPEVLERLVKLIPLRRPADPDEIFLAVKFVIECDFFTGRCIDVDGGQVL
ncbi:MAG: SDR family oxidoreductase [Myxococcota bacterium]|nr:SDR family oxidoreductase [Myxococcota bacterium]MEC9391618.1 SDR family oxidoreductase [Myxococcota bacterium]